MLEKFLISIGLKQPEPGQEYMPNQPSTVRPSGENSFIDDDNIGNTYDILKSISDDTYNEMLKKGKELYQDYFSLQGVFENIIKRV